MAFQPPPPRILFPVFGILLLIKVAQHCENLGILKITEQIYHYRRHHVPKRNKKHIYAKERPAPD